MVAMVSMLHKLDQRFHAVTCCPMELLDAVLKRRMVRNFSERPLEPRIVMDILNCATHAPSAGFTQGWEFIVISDPHRRQQFWEKTTTAEWRTTSRRSEGLRRAPVLILPLTNPDIYFERYSLPDKAASGLGKDNPNKQEAWPVPYWWTDLAFAVMLMLIRATDLGVACAFMGIFRGEKEVLKELGVPQGYRPIGVVALGYPQSPDPPSPSLRRGRRSVDEIVHYEGWNR